MAGTVFEVGVVEPLERGMLRHRRRNHLRVPSVSFRTKVPRIAWGFAAL